MQSRTPAQTTRRPSRRRFFLIVALGLAGWGAWQIVGNTAADTRVQMDPTAALEWRPHLAAALYTIAEQKLVAAKTDQDLREVTDLAQDMLASRPADEAPLRQLGLLADLRNDSASSQALMTEAGARSLRDTVAQVWLFDAKIARGDLAAALPNADAVLRTRPDLSDRFLPAMAAIARDSTAESQLVALLAANPPWRRWLLQGLPGVVDPSAMFKVLSDLQADGSINTGDLRPYLDQLVASGQFDVGYLAWLHFLPADDNQTVRYAYNGDFEQDISNLPFDWVASDIKGAKTDVADSGDPALGKAVRVTFSDTRVPYSNLAKLMILPPGTYRLFGMVHADQLKNERGLAWNVYCAEGDKQRVGGSSLFQGNLPWQPFNASFTVPATGCQAQWLKLELGARGALEQQISGEIWFDNLAVTRSAVEPLNTPPDVASPPPASPSNPTISTGGDSIPTITLQ